MPDFALGGSRASAAGQGNGPTPSEPALCKECAEHKECTGNDSLCLRSPGSREGICGFACREGCPERHVCVRVESTFAPPQCTPVSDACSGQTTAFEEMPSQVDAANYLLMLVNRLRTDRGLLALALDECLTREASAATFEWVRSGKPHGYYLRTCEPMRPNCACGWEQEDQGFSNDLSRGWEAAIKEVIFDELRDRPNHGFINNIFAESMTRMGVGIVLDKENLWFTLAFGSLQP